MCATVRLHRHRAQRAAAVLIVVEDRAVAQPRGDRVGRGLGIDLHHPERLDLYPGGHGQHAVVDVEQVHLGRSGLRSGPAWGHHQRPLARGERDGVEARGGGVLVEELLSALVIDEVDAEPFVGESVRIAVRIVHDEEAFLVDRPGRRVFAPDSPICGFH